MACILALDTSSEACSVALIKEEKMYSAYEVVPRDHTRKIMPMVQQILTESDTKPGELDFIAFGCGPGSFTGLRIAAGVTQGLAYGLGISVIPVSTLEAMALEATDVKGDGKSEGRVAVAIDARMDEVYFGVFDVNGNNVTALQNEQVCKPESVELSHKLQAGADSVSGVGSGWAFVSRMNPRVQEIVTVKDESLLAKAEYIARIAESKLSEVKTTQGSPVFVSAEQAIPVYLRDSVTWKKLPGR